MTTNPKAQSVVALPATRPETFYPTYSEWSLQQILSGGAPSTYLTQTVFDTVATDTSQYVQPYALPVNIPIVTKAQARDALRTILPNKQAAFAKRYAEEQAKIFEELQKLTAIGYEEGESSLKPTELDQYEEEAVSAGTAYEVETPHPDEDEDGLEKEWDEAEEEGELEETANFEEASNFTGIPAYPDAAKNPVDVPEDPKDEWMLPDERDE